MIKLITHDDQLKPICNVWNAIHQDSPFYEEVSLGSGEKLRSIYILVSIPVLEHRNLSISPQIFKFDGLFDIQIPFRFPKDIDAYPDLSPVLNALTSSISDHLTVYTNIKPLQRYRVELYMNVRNEYLIGMLGSRTDSAHKYLTFNEIVNLRDMTSEAFIIGSNSESRKGEDMNNNPNVAMTFYWPEVGRQVRIVGVAEPASNKENKQDFIHRHPHSRALSIIAIQSQKLSNMDELDQEMTDAKKLIEEDKDIHRTWTLYKIMPTEMEFFQARKDLAHFRLKYEKIDGRWQHGLLWP